MPAIVSRAWEAGEASDGDKAREYNEKIMIATSILRLAKGGGPDGAAFSAIKSALKSMGVIDHDHVSRPLRQLTEEEKLPIPEVLRTLGLVT